MNNKKGFFCFSPPVMIAMFFIEIFGAIYAILRYKMDAVGRLVVAILVCLGVFQLAEYMICEVIALPGLTWSRIGYVAITLLPPLGISLTMALAGKKSLKAQVALYSFAAIFMAFFLLVRDSITGQVCYGNYVFFDMMPGSVHFYAAYYYGLLGLGVYLAMKWRGESKELKTRKALFALAIGYMTFIIPTTAVNIINPETIRAIPSIMCGFAVLLAIALIGQVLPNGGTLRKASKKQ